MAQEGYKYLTSYKLSTVVYDLTVDFCRRYISYKSRTNDQMVQAARSGKQNIAEGYSQGTSLKGYIKLLGVAKGSIQELLEDYQDYLRQNNLELWDINHPKIRVFRDFRVDWVNSNNLNSPISLIDPLNPTEFANLMVTLCRQTLFLLTRQITSLEEKFIKEGGWSENLFKRRYNSRSDKS